MPPRHKATLTVGLVLVATGLLFAASTFSSDVKSVLTALGLSSTISTDRLIGRDTAGTGAYEQITVGGGVEFTGSGGVRRSALSGDVTASAGSNSVTVSKVAGVTPGTAGLAVLDDATVGDVRTTLGLGTIATQDANNVSISGGSVTGITDITVADGGTGASSLTDHGVLVGSGTSAVDALTVGTNGQVLIGQTGADPAFTTIGGGAVLSASGNLVISREMARLGGSTVLGTSLPMWATTGASGSLTTLVVVPVWLDAGCTVTHIEFCSSAAATLPTHYWFALYSPAMALLAQTADQTTTAWGAATKKSLALASGQAISTSGNYGVGFYMESTASCSLLRFSPLINATLPDTTIAGYYGTGYGATAPASPARTASQTHWWWCQVKGTIP